MCSEVTIIYMKINNQTVKRILLKMPDLRVQVKILKMAGIMIELLRYNIWLENFRLCSVRYYVPNS